jgi:hypothetical protein
MQILLSVLMSLLLVGCVTAPSNTANVCSIFREKHDWYGHTRKAFRKWGVPIPVQMAIINQESSFAAVAKPPRYRFLGLIPLWRLSSAYGYGQVKDTTWRWYVQKTGNRGADRDEFEDVVDFIGWYADQSRRQLGISKYDAYRQYLAYHEGHAGYRRGTYRAKSWLQRAARRVAASAWRYQRQLNVCRIGIESRDL